MSPPLADTCASWSFSCATQAGSWSVDTSLQPMDGSGWQNRCWTLTAGCATKVTTTNPAIEVLGDVSATAKPFTYSCQLDSQPPQHFTVDPSQAPLKSTFDYYAGYGQNHTTLYLCWVAGLDGQAHTVTVISESNAPLGLVHAVSQNLNNGPGGVVGDGKTFYSQGTVAQSTAVSGLVALNVASPPSSSIGASNATGVNATADALLGSLNSTTPAATSLSDISNSTFHLTDVSDAVVWVMIAIVAALVLGGAGWAIWWKWSQKGAKGNADAEATLARKSSRSGGRKGWDRVTDSSDEESANEKMGLSRK